MTPILIGMKNPEQPSYVYEYLLQVSNSEREEIIAKTQRDLGLPDDVIMEYKPARVVYKKPYTKTNE